jgi:hypothetical protein
MAEGSHHLSNQIYEMGIMGIVGEIIGNLNSRRTLQQFLLAFEEEDDDPLFVLLKQVNIDSFIDFPEPTYLFRHSC